MNPNGPQVTTESPRARRSSRDSIINRSRLRRFALDAASQRHHRFTRVSEEFVEQAEAHLRTWVREYVRQLPSLGKTIK
jgi:hypothetical protein